jgi:hypothetical protein
VLPNSWCSHCHQVSVGAASCSYLRVVSPPMVPRTGVAGYPVFGAFELDAFEAEDPEGLPNSYRWTSHRRRQPGRGAGVPEGRQSAPAGTRPLDRLQGHRTRVAINLAIISSRLRPIKATGSETPGTKVLFRQGAADSSHKRRSP